MADDDVKMETKNHDGVRTLIDVSKLSREQLTSYILTLPASDMDGPVEVLVPRNVLKLKSDLDATVKKRGATFLDARIKVEGYTPVMTGKVVRQTLAEGPVHEVIYGLERMARSPELVTREFLNLADQLFEYSECLFASVTVFFPSKGCSGQTMASPAMKPTEEQARMMFNAMVGHAEAFKDEMRKNGIDLDRGQIIIPRGRGRVR